MKFKSTTEAKIEDLGDCLNHQYEGYYWYSDKSYPCIILDKKIDPDWFGELPFVIEGNFYSSKEKISISIKNVDGNYRITKYDLKDWDLKRKGEKYKVETYIGHDIQASKEEYFKMIEVWQETKQPVLVPKQKEGKDEFEEMTTLVPAWSAFVGFGKEIK